MIRFKYTLTLAFEKYVLPAIAITIGLCAASVFSAYSPLSETWTFLCAVVVYYFSSVFGAGFVSMSIGEWMRKRTLWQGQWEVLFKEDINNRK